jgi:hypothetical protein
MIRPFTLNRDKETFYTRYTFQTPLLKKHSHQLQFYTQAKSDLTYVCVCVIDACYCNNITRTIKLLFG